MSIQNDKYAAFLNGLSEGQKGTCSKKDAAMLQITNMMIQQQGGRVDKIVDDTVYVTVPKINNQGEYAKEFAESIKKLFNTSKDKQYRLKYRVM